MTKAKDAEVYALSSTEYDSSTEHKIRLQKIALLEQSGIEPWAPTEEVTHTSCDVINDFQENQEQSSAIYTIAGRVMVMRIHGKAAFADVQDRSGRLQLYIKCDDIGQDQFTFFKDFIDIGDIIWCQGYSFKTKTGQITLHVQKYKLLTKCLHPLPEKFHGLTDIETKYRQRYLDIMTNIESKTKFLTRACLIKSVRDYLDSYDFIEVETPMLHPIPGGAAARPFITHHNTLHTDFYLRIAPELYLKRLVVGGFERVYEINRNFRNEGISTRHNPEFTMLEFYMAHKDYLFIMDFVENMLKHLMQKVCHTLKISFGEYCIDFNNSFQRLSPQEALVKYSSITAHELDATVIDSTLAAYNITPTAAWSQGEKVFALFEKLVEEKLINPTFIIDFPIEISPLAKRDPHNSCIAARFELFIAGMEIANGFNELNNPFEQSERFHEQVKAHAGGNEEAMRFDADYITALEYGLPPTVGVGIGIDRLTMLFTNTLSIKDVILFPALKKKE